MTYRVIPGILRNSEAEYLTDLRAAEQFAEWIQIDIVDTSYAPQASVGPDIIGKYTTQIPAEIDLMVHNPQDYLNQLLKLPFVDRLILHVEAHGNLQNAINTIRDHRKNAGIALNPDTAVSFLSSVHGFDQITCMTVTPGSQGQPFQDRSLENVRQLRGQFPDLPIEVDGSINPVTLLKAKDAGANVFVSGSFILWNENPKEQYEQLAALITQ